MSNLEKIFISQLDNNYVKDKLEKIGYKFMFQITHRVMLVKSLLIALARK